MGNEIPRMKVIITFLKLYHVIEMKILDLELFPWSFLVFFRWSRTPVPLVKFTTPRYGTNGSLGSSSPKFPISYEKTNGVSRPTSWVMEWITTHWAVSSTLGVPLSWPTQLNEDFHWLWSLQWSAVVFIEPWGSSSMFGAALTFGLCLLLLLDTTLLGLDS